MAAYGRALAAGEGSPCGDTWWWQLVVTAPLAMLSPLCWEAGLARGSRGRPNTGTRASRTVLRPHHGLAGRPLPQPSRPPLTLYLSPFTSHPLPLTLYLSPFTPHPLPLTLYPSPFTSHPALQPLPPPLPRRAPRPVRLVPPGGHVAAAGGRRGRLAALRGRRRPGALLEVAAAGLPVRLAAHGRATGRTLPGGRPGRRRLGGRAGARREGPEAS
jgi:hypothetical protein